uniref:6-phosphogluconolactonase n=1 Tax=Steinernema glaseri TaxID=37863 RepID=A0A1I7YMX1_9BILA
MDLVPVVVKAMSVDDLHAKFRQFLIREIKTASLAEQNRMIIGVSGGSMPKLVCEVFKTIKEKDVDYPLSKIHLFAVDERLVPTDSDDSNTGAYLRLLPEELKRNFAPFVNHIDAGKCADEYEKVLLSWKPPTDGPWPIFDLLLLGMGPDGHTCSLFPGHPLLQEESLWVAPIEDSPKPPPRRITVTLPVINNAKQVAFIATGAGKEAVVKAVVGDKDLQYPCALVQPVRNPVTWFVDEQSGRLLNSIPISDAGSSH